LKYEDQKSIKGTLRQYFNDTFQKIETGQSKTEMHLCVSYQPGLINVRKSQKEIVVSSIPPIFFLISALASKMGYTKKIKAHFYNNYSGYLTKFLLF
jgi:hypothetical protein